MNPSRKNFTRFETALARSIEHTGLPLNGRWRQVAFYKICKLIVLLRLPLVSSLAKKFIGLVSGYESEIAFFSDESKGDAGATPRLMSTGKSIDVYDFAIVGSGPGAASAFLEINKDASVVVVESGNSQSTPPEMHHTLRHVKNDFYKSGKEYLLARNLPLFTQGSTLGGGSQVNSGLYHDMPEYLASELMDYAQIPEKEYLLSQKEIRGLLKLSLMEVDEQNSIIAKGAARMEIPYKNVERWRRYKDGSHFENQHFGVREVIWNKYLTKESHVRFLLNTTASRIIHDSKHLLVKLDDGKFIKARNVIVSGGPIQTPYLLAKSGLISWRDVKFQWHPMIRIICECDPETLGFLDVDPFQAWTKDKRYKFGSGVSTPGLLALALTKYLSPNEIFNLRSFYVSFTSSGKGGMLPGTKIPWYKFSDGDRSKISSGAQMLLELIELGGAKPLQDSSIIRKQLSTVHVFGTLPYNSRIFKPGTNKLNSCRNVLVADSSLFTQGPGVNPQGPMMNMARLLTRRGLEA